MPLKDSLDCLSGDDWAALYTRNDFSNPARSFQRCAFLYVEALGVMSAQGEPFRHCLLSTSGEEGAELDTGLVWWGLGVKMESPLVLIKDNKQPFEELSFSLSLRQKGSVSFQ